jgi:hypothetical protein
VRKEHAVLAELQRLVPQLTAASTQVVWDCPVPGGCSLKRPDLLCAFSGRYLQIEVDEEGRQDTSCVDEDTRLEVIAADVDLRGLVLRLNPDYDGCLRFKRLNTGERYITVGNQDAWQALMGAAAVAARAFLEGPAPAGVSARGFPSAWWDARAHGASASSASSSGAS